ncbi:MAG: Holliday junction branch migration protein RuvA [Desulfuromonadales bacterium]|nr:Holliday junction branch migration protein RuvA [Desulfuromonadales bacterium]MDT8423282.1 Holliday junction branch migration protein RuvA [Desulfuromonadales bacterium]
MIALIRGQIAFKSLDHVIIDVGGVGYRLSIPLTTFYALPESGEVRLHVYTQVREDAINLFGFLTMEDKALFKLLLSISGVGPKVAINILSHLSAPDLRQALATSDVARLSGIPGIGKKTAERLALELRDKIAKTVADNGGDTVTYPSPGNILDDALSALMNLGYKEKQAQQTLNALEIAPEATVEDVLKGALKVLVK